MTRDEAKKFIVREIKTFRKAGMKRPAGATATTDYEKGQVVGMVKAFKEMEVLNEDDRMV